MTAGTNLRVRSRSEKAVALVIVLSFVVLLTVVVVAFLSRATTERQVSGSSANSERANTLALSALHVVVGDLKDEIVASSTTTSSGGVTTYSPKMNSSTPVGMTPWHTGGPKAGATPIPNLVSRSVRSSDTTSDSPYVSYSSDYTSPPANRAADDGTDTTSSTKSSLNGRSVSLARWNSHYLVPRLNASTTIDSTPVTSFVPPDWVLVSRSGPVAATGMGAGATALNQPSPSNGSYVTGRYAYAVYDEGGLLDINVAGYPSPSPSPVPPSYVMNVGRKGALAFADLTAVPTSTAAPPSTFPPAQVNNIVGWRNFASIGLQNDTPPSGTIATNHTFTSAAAVDYYSFVKKRTDGFMSVNAQPYTSPGSAASRTDQAFVTRQQLLRFRRLTDFSQNALQFLGTFSRELDIPSCSPTSATSINPDLRLLRVTASFIRNDGTIANVGEPLVNRRFLLQRLNWLTYKGPSAARSAADMDMSLLTNTYSLALSFLQQGTDLSQAAMTATTANIYKYFGLVWDGTNERWKYIGHPNNPSTASPPAASISTLDSMTGLREPDFFELLQAGILTGSLGDSIPSTFPVAHQQSKLLQLLTIGANLISQATVDSYPTRIACTVGGVVMEGIGTERLPFVNALAACPVGSSLTTGGVSWFLIPNLWDPYRNTADMTTLPLRPAVQVTITGNFSFAAIDSSGAATAVAGPVNAGSVSRALLSGSSAGGRDGASSGFPEPAKLDTGDLPPAATTPTPAAFTAYPFASESSNGSSAAVAWRTTNALSGSNKYVVFRAGHPGSAIGPTILGKTPALILNPNALSTEAFQVSVDYQSPTNSANWYPYSFLQGSSDRSTWMGKLQIKDPTTVYSQVTVTPAPTATPYATKTIATAANTSQIAPWAMSTLNGASTLMKSDPRSTRFNSTLDTLTDATASPTPVAAVVNSIWPSGITPQNLGSGAANPAVYSQNTGGYPDTDSKIRLGDNGPSGTNPYRATTNLTSPWGDPVRPLVLNRPLRSVAEMGYAFRDQPFKTLDFLTSNTADASLLDLFSVSENTTPSGIRAGVVNLNTRQGSVIGAMISGALQRDDSASSTVISNDASTIGSNVANATATTPLASRAGIVGVVANDGTLPLTKTQHESIDRALVDAGQTRTWNLLIDVIAQSGRYPPTAADLSQFVVEGEKRYWLHVAIDRFTGEVIDQQLEAVYE